MLLPEDIEPPPFTDDDLDEYFDWLDGQNAELRDLIDTGQGLEPPSLESAVAAWSVCDTGSAEYAMRKLAHAEALIAQRKEEAEAFKAQIERWLAGEITRPKKAVNFFTGQLESYARRKREEDEILTLNLPSGQVTSRRNPARPAVAEDKPTRAAFIEWAKARELPLVKATWSPVMDEIKKRVTFERVRVPDFGGEELVLVRWPNPDGESVWVALPEALATQTPHTHAEDLPNFHDEVWPIYDGQRVPGVGWVPEEVTYTVKPAKP